jgi:hypothetical protein
MEFDLFHLLKNKNPPANELLFANRVNSPLRNPLNIELCDKLQAKSLLRVIDLVKLVFNPATWFSLERR